MNLRDDLLAAFRDYPDFPKPGIVFKDMCPILRDPGLFKRVIQSMAESAKKY